MNNRRSLGKNGLVDGVGRSGAAVHNTAPTASFTATPSTGVAVGDTVNLDASGSSDPEGDALTYAWTITDPSSNTTSLSGETPSFTIDKSGTWTIDLTVTDTGGLTDDASDTVVVVSPYQLVADTSPDLLVPLNYASTSADGQILYQDSAAITPVDAAGEPIGGVSWADNTVAVSVAVDAERPIFTTQASEPAGYALFDGVDAEIDIGGLGDFDYLHLTSGLAVTMWAVVRFDAAKSAGNRSTIMGSSASSSVSGIWFAYEDAVGPGNALRLLHSNGSKTTDLYSSANSISDELWHTVAVTYTAADYAFYIDGVLDESGIWSPNTSTKTNDSVLELGQDWATSAAPLDGGIAVAGIWNRVLTASEISDLHAWSGI